MDAVLALLDEGHPAVTGWCRLDRTHPLANVTRYDLHGNTPFVGAYSFYKAAEIEAADKPYLFTGFMGMCLSGMSRDLWLRHPMGVFGELDVGWSSDFYLSMRLRDAGVPMVVARDAYVDHVKETWLKLDRAEDKRLLIGELPREVIWQRGNT